MTTKKVNIPAFFSQPLSDAVEATQERFHEFRRRLDRISNDIKTLEEYLGSSQIHFAFVYQLGERIPNKRDLEIGAYSPTSIAGCMVEVIREFLEWDKDQSGRYRLLFRHSIYEGELLAEFAVPFYRLQPQPKEVSKRPLIEMPIESRLFVYPKLPAFVEELGKAISQSDLASDSASFERELDIILNDKYPGKANLEISRLV